MNADKLFDGTRNRDRLERILFEEQFFPRGVPMTLDTAIVITAIAHQGQRDKAGAHYIMHPLRVMERMDTEHERMAAVLHDVMEDTSTSKAALMQAGCPTEVVEALVALTHKPAEDYGEYVERCAANPIARKVKLADLADNMDIRRLYAVSPQEDWPGLDKRMERYTKAWLRLRKATP